MKNPSAFSFFVAVLLCLGSAAAAAQSVYRIVGPDGKVTFSDKPPASSEQGKVAGVGVGGAGAAGNSALPYEIRQVAGKYPVTIYTTKDCGPCDSARGLLTARGVPFTERTVSTPEDASALQRLSGDTSLPFMTLGSQRIRGFSDVEWSQYLDAAGYPKTSVLPASYRNPAATPLVNVQAAAAAEPKPAPAAEPSAPPPPPGSNPAGIIF